MAKHRRVTAEEPRVTAEEPRVAAEPRVTDEGPAEWSGDEVGRNLGGEYWSVDDCVWSTLHPHLPENLVELLAPPIVVGTVRAAVPSVAGARPAGDASRARPR